MPKSGKNELHAQRTYARELFMQLLFQMEAQNDYSAESKERFAAGKELSPEQSAYFNRIFEMITKHLPDIDEKLDAYSKKWKINRMAKVDLAVLRLSAAEVLYMDDIPDSVSINEAVDIGKKYGGEDSGKFINGILGNLARSKADAAE